MSSERGVVIRSAGDGAILLDAAQGRFTEETQEKIWALAADLKVIPAIRETVPGMNNLLVIFDPFAIDPAILEKRLHGLWANIEALPLIGKAVELPVVYGGRNGEDLGEWARHCGLSADEIVKRHSSATYRVAALGAMPGFPYLSGLPPELAMDRRDIPRLSVPRGAVIIGGAQAGVMPTDAPSGWHVIGHTNVALFQIDRDEPATLAPGDTVRFLIAGFEDD